MDFKEFIINLCDAIEGLEANDLSPATELKGLEEWDSLALITTVVMIDSAYQVSVSGNALGQCNTVQDIFDLVKNAST